jgi:glycosyltransferase involved in cell wall biosynthesis
MRIVIDATPVGVVTPDKGGVYRYIFQLINALARLDTGEDFLLFFNYFSRRHATAMEHTLARLNLPSNFGTRVARLPGRLWVPLGLPVEVSTGRFDVFHNCIDWLPRILLGKGVVTIHDVRYLEPNLPPIDPDSLKWLHESAEWQADYRNRVRHLGELKRTISRTVRKADRIITVSNFTKARLVEKLGVDPGRITVVHHGVDPRYRPQSSSRKAEVRQRYGLPQRYVVYVGKLDPWKDLPTLFEAIARSSERQVDLVMAGPCNWYKNYLDQRLHALGIAQRVRFTGYVAEEDLPAIYSAAECAVLPSLYEGFGLPVLEAMACGTPVVASGVGAVPEVTGECARLVRPGDSRAMTEALDELLAGERQHASMVEAGLARAAMFSWQRCAQETLAQYRYAMN